MDVSGHLLSTPLISQGQFDLAERWTLRLEVLPPPFPWALPRGVGQHGRNSVGVFTCWKANADTVSAATEVSFGRETGAYPPGKADTPSSVLRAEHTNRNNALQVHGRAVFLSPGIFHYSACFHH